LRSPLTESLLGREAWIWSSTTPYRRRAHRRFR
jgi:hypothetical protein